MMLIRLSKIRIVFYITKSFLNLKTPAGSSAQESCALNPD